MLKNAKKSTYAAIFTFALIFMIGLLVFKDYGITVDEPIQRVRSLVTYKYIMSVLFGRSIPALSSYPLTAVYQGQYYGVFLQMPMVFIEDLAHFSMKIRSVWLMRHLFTYLYCYLGYLCFYFMGRKIFRNDWLALLGTAMLFLYPRFFASQFFYIKDTLYAATVMASMWATVMFLEKGESFRWGAVFCIVTAISANLRFISLMFPALLITYLFMRDLFVTYAFRKGFRAVWKRIGTYAALAAGFFLVYLMITPACWSNTIRSFFNTIHQFASYQTWGGTVVLLGKIIPWFDIPRLYIPVWLAVSLPVVYLLLFAISLPLFVLQIVRICKKPASCAVPNADMESTSHIPGEAALFAAPFRYWVFAGAVFFLPLLLVVVNRSVVYNDWRQMYFLLAPLVVCCLFALQQLLSVIKKKLFRYAVISILLASLIFQAGWIVVNHPFEIVYFNRIAATCGDQFDRDTSRSSVYSALRYLAEHVPEKEITLSNIQNDFFKFHFALNLLPANQRARFVVTEGGDYVIETYRNVVGNTIVYSGYSDWYSFSVDGFHVVTIFKKTAN